MDDCRRYAADQKAKYDDDDRFRDWRPHLAPPIFLGLAPHRWRFRIFDLEGTCPVVTGWPPGGQRSFGQVVHLSGASGQCARGFPLAPQSSFATRFTNSVIDVRYWHKADIVAVLSDVRFWE
jgi:hypothetical protein